LDNFNLKYSGGDLMVGTHTVQYDGFIGRVKAYNQPSAEAQMEWVVKHGFCLCHICRAALENMYLVSFTQIPLSQFTPAHKENA